MCCHGTGVDLFADDRVRPSPPPTSTRKPISPAASRLSSRPMSWHWMTAAVFGGAIHGNLELARQEGELRGGRCSTGG